MPMTVSNVFTKVDTNKDGKIDTTELKAAARAAGVTNPLVLNQVVQDVMKADANKDGALALDEFQAGAPKDSLLAPAERDGQDQLRGPSGGVLHRCRRQQRQPAHHRRVRARVPQSVSGEQRRQCLESEPTWPRCSPRICSVERRKQTSPSTRCESLRRTS